MTLRLTQTAEFLRSSHISRWGIVQTAKQQSIAEHAYRVYLLVRDWGRLLEFSPEDQKAAEELALLHDLPEIRTGDAPTPHKSPEVKVMLAEIEEEIFPELAKLEKRCSRQVRDLVKFADTAESVLFLRVNGLGRHAEEVMELLEKQMKNRLVESCLSYNQREKLLNSYSETKHLT